MKDLDLEPDVGHFVGVVTMVGVLWRRQENNSKSLEPDLNI